MTKEKLWQRSKQKIRFQNDDMDFYFAWILSQRRRFGSEGGSAVVSVSTPPPRLRMATRRVGMRPGQRLLSASNRRQPSPWKKGIASARTKATCALSRTTRALQSSSAREGLAGGMPGKRRNGASGKRRLNSACLSNQSRFHIGGRASSGTRTAAGRLRWVMI